MFVPSPRGYTWQQRAELWARYRAGDSIRETARDLASCRISARSSEYAPGSTRRRAIRMRCSPEICSTRTRCADR